MVADEHRQPDVWKPRGWCLLYLMVAAVGMVLAQVAGYYSARGMADAKGGIGDDGYPWTGDALFLGMIYAIFIIPSVLLVTSLIHLAVHLIRSRRIVTDLKPYT